MQREPAQAAEWVSEAYRNGKFADHGARLRVKAVSEYNASARETIREGARFTYTHGNPPATRVGYYDARRSRLTVLDHDEVTILNHFRATERYVRSLPDSDYAW
jgi:hypothetical protein